MKGEPIRAIAAAIGPRNLIHPLNKQCCEAQLGADHPNTASSLNNLARLYYSMGRYAEAEPLYLRTIQIVLAALGQDHSNTQTVIGNFRYLLQQAIAAGRTTELSNHPLTQPLLQQLQSESILRFANPFKYLGTRIK